MNPNFLNLFRKKLTPRPGGAYHFCQHFLTHLGDHSLLLTFLPEMSEQ
jgi:hypothetical protein